MPAVSEATLCMHCRRRLGLHGGAGNPVRPYACPADRSFPGWPRDMRPERLAEEVFDQRIRGFWAERSTSFSPMR